MENKNNQNLRNMSLKYKFIIVTLIVAIVPLIIFATTITLMYSSAIVRRSNKHIEENIRIMTDRIDTVFNDGELCSNYLTLNLSEIANDVAIRPMSKTSRNFQIMNQSVLIFKGISSIVYIDEKNIFYTTDIKLYNQEELIKSSEMLQTVKQNNNGKTILFDMDEDCMQPIGGAQVVTMGKKVINVTTGKTLGYLFININAEYVKKFVDNEISSYLLYDSLGNCIMQDQESLFASDDKIQKRLFVKEDTKSIEYWGETYLVARGSISRYGWTLVGVTNLNEFNVSRRELFSIIFFTGLVIVLLLGIATALTSSSITKPLTKLKAGAKQIAEGDLSVEFHFKTKDEIGLLGDIFNHMTKRIQLLLQQVDEEAKKKREYELALIQEQVKPHFLYNTLDIIIMLIDMNRSKDAQRVTKKLANYYKNSLSDSAEIIHLEREMQIVEDYLELQIMRYGDKFTYEIEMSQEIEQASIPKMTLQPLVENAIYHGLKYKEEWGTIRIQAIKENDNLLITIEDNGIGMLPKTLDKTRELLQKPADHFGLYSANHRLKLYYGEEYGLSIESAYQKGTIILIKIPYREIDN